MTHAPMYTWPGMGALAAAFLLSAGAATHAETVTISCGSTGKELTLCRQGADAWAARTGNTVKYVTMPASDTLSLTQQLLAAHAGDIDIFQADVAWAGILGNHLLDLTQSIHASGAQHFGSLLASATVNGRIVGAPWFGDAGVLYLREDLLRKYNRAIPKTWEELQDTAAYIQTQERQRGDARMWGFVWQGRAYEGLTCNALEWVASSGGGTILDGTGNITINNRNAKDAISRAASWVGTITPPGVLNYTEEEARGVFQSGHAVFMRNWPYAWSLVNGADSPVAGKVRLVALPAGGRGGQSTGTLAGSMLVVNAYSRHKEAAASLVMFLTSASEQKRRAIQASYNPTLPALYHDPDILKAAPYLQSLFATFAEATARPSAQSGTKYNRVSVEFSNAVHAVLSGEDGVDDRIASLERRLKRIRKGGKW
jgi:trehalose/maltose transport system substrate-binding protein